MQQQQQPSTAPIAVYLPQQTVEADILRHTPIDGSGRQRQPPQQPAAAHIAVPANGLQAPLFSAFGGGGAQQNTPSKLRYESQPAPPPASLRPIFDRSTLRRRTQLSDRQRQQQQQAPLVADNTLGDGYTPQYAPYDGVARTEEHGNGFEYYLPRHYHREAASAAGERRRGDFGYIDPFGIRRVVYYEATPDCGLRQRQNNRYVGFGATPYDPRPLET